MLGWACGGVKTFSENCPFSLFLLLTAEVLTPSLLGQDGRGRAAGRRLEKGSFLTHRHTDRHTHTHADGSYAVHECDGSHGTLIDPDSKLSLSLSSHSCSNFHHVISSPPPFTPSSPLYYNKSLCYMLDKFVGLRSADT